MSPASLSRPRALVASAVAVAALALYALGGLAGNDLLCLAPALMLLWTLAARCYPGEQLLVQLAARPQARRPRPGVLRHAPRACTVRMPRGGLLMGFALAVRPPPRCLSAG